MTPEIVKAIRKQLHMNRRQAAALVGYSGSMWGFWECGRRAVPALVWQQFMDKTAGMRARVRADAMLASHQLTDLAALQAQRLELDKAIGKLEAALAPSLRKPKCDLL